jgi:hypothetical protein
VCSQCECMISTVGAHSPYADMTRVQRHASAAELAKLSASVQASVDDAKERAVTRIDEVCALCMLLCAAPCASNDTIATRQVVANFDAKQTAVQQQISAAMAQSSNTGARIEAGVCACSCVCMRARPHPHPHAVSKDMDDKLSRVTDTLSNAMAESQRALRADISRLSDEAAQAREEAGKRHDELQVAWGRVSLLA